MKGLIKSTLNIDVSKELIRIAIKKIGLTRKKAHFYGAPSTLPAKTEEFIRKREQFKNEQRKFISIDETSFGRNGINTRGYSLKGVKLHIQKKIARMTTMSVVYAVSKDKVEGSQKMVGSFNSDKFVEFIKSLYLKPNDVILLDNVKFHHSLKVKEYCQQHHIDLLYVPPYSPWMNPIELCFSIIKRDYYKYQDVDRALKSLNNSHLEAFFIKSLNCDKQF